MSNEVKKITVAWLSKQRYWVQFAAKKIIENEEITEDILGNLLVFLKTPEENYTNDLVDISFFSEPTESNSFLKIKSIGNIQGIDDLSPRAPLTFFDDEKNKNLSVIYGQNGSGKSGYTRILKKACGKSTIPLVSNVFKASPEKQQCLIEWDVNGQIENKTWDAKSSPITELEVVDIYDSNTGGSYLEGEKGLSYLPLEVSFFYKLAEVYKKIDTHLNGEIDNIKKLPNRPSDFGSSEYINYMYSLTHKTDVEKTKEFYLYSDEDEKKLKSLEERINTAPQNLANQKEKRIRQIVGLKELFSTSINLVSKNSCENISELYSQVKAKKRAAEQAAEALAENSEIEGIGDETWKSMWLAAKKYSEEVAYQDNAYPNLDEDAVCVLCHQEVDDKAKTRLENFSSYVNGEIQAQLEQAKNEYNEKIENLPKEITEDNLMTRIQAAQLDEDEWLLTLKEVAESIEKVKSDIKANKFNDLVSFEFDQELIGKLNAEKDRLEDEVRNHKENAEPSADQQAKTERNDLKAKKWANSYIEVMIGEIARLKGINRITEWKKAVNTTSLSNTASKVSAKMFTESYVKRFKTELNYLGANKIDVEIVKSGTSRGQVKYKLQLKKLKQSNNKPLTILSDGEKKIISLAAFLADVTGKSSKSPFIFDDPISSLDQDYEEATARRLIVLSEERQVIVLTHRLSFLGLLQNGSAEVHDQYICRESWGCGEPSSLPLFAKNPIGAMKNLKNDKLAKAKRAIEEKGTGVGDPLIQDVCSNFRILLEGTIEIELLAGIVKRHQREVSTQGKLSKLAKINQQDCNLLEELMTRYSAYLHSQSPEAPVTLPISADIESDIESVIEWHTEFKARRVVTQ